MVATNSIWIFLYIAALKTFIRSHDVFFFFFFFLIDIYFFLLFLIAITFNFFILTIIIFLFHFFFKRSHEIKFRIWFNLMSFQLFMEFCVLTREFFLKVMTIGEVFSSFNELVSYHLDCIICVLTIAFHWWFIYYLIR